MIVCVEPGFTPEPGDLYTSNLNPQYVGHGDTVRHQCRTLAPTAEVICTGTVPFNLHEKIPANSVINLSLAHTTGEPLWMNPVYRQLMGEWIDAGHIVVLAIGNKNVDVDALLEWDDPRLILVGANGYQRASKAPFRTDVFAPARWTDADNHGWTGTSFSAPRVSAAAHNLLPHKPFDCDEMRQLLRNTRDSNGDLNERKALAEVVGFPWRYDFDGDYRIGFSDFLLFSKQYGKVLSSILTGKGIT